MTPQAPIVGFCDFGVVGDLTEVLPRLNTLLGEPRPAVVIDTTAAVCPAAPGDDPRGRP